MKSKYKDDEDGMLGDGLAELARKQLRNRQAQLDDILGEVTGTKPSTVQPKKAAPVKVQKGEKTRQEFL